MREGGVMGTATKATAVRLAREARGIPQGRVARVVGVTQATLSRIELGLQIPTLPVAARLAQVLGVRLDFLFPEIPKTEADGKEVRR